MADSCTKCDCDLVVIGAGPAGLSTAVYAGAEECSVRLLDAGDRPGGQAGQSTQIRNFFGFPDGISGPDLAARGLDGALSFGVDIRAPVHVHHVAKDTHGRFHVATTDETFTAKSVVIATGATPRRHRAKGVAAYHGRGVSYRGPDSATMAPYSGRAWIIGGGNSAGQAATFLSRHGCDVHVVVRGDGLAASMSRYLISEMQAAENITLHTHTTLEAVIGNGQRRMDSIYVSGPDGHRDERADHLFLMLGSDPNTAWLRDTLLRNAKGYVLTGAEVYNRDEDWHTPMPHETSVPGIFAAGDVRAGSLKRVAAAVGEGAGAYFDVHRYLNA